MCECQVVVPGDQAAGRIANPKVRHELAFEQVQKAKREAADAIARAENDRADRVLGEADLMMAACPCDHPRPCNAAVRIPAGGPAR